MRWITVLFLLLAASAADRDLAGRYAGQWKSTGSGGEGAIRLNLEPGADGAWKCDVVFTFAGSDVTTTVKSVKLNQSKLEISYDFDLLGNKLRSKTEGQWDGKAFTGHYWTTVADGDTDVDQGEWNATPAK
ncbi:MAG TPA: hypothetical protein VMH81_38155 [Bryobacteraceae bacterium]|nr:hypothetical protein [Bryobacteraceae bacterium]